MIQQYPYTLEVLNIVEGEPDANGDYAVPLDSWQTISKCRDEAGNGRKITLEDGSAFEYNFLIQMPKGVESIAVGKKVRVKDGNSVRATGEIKYSRKDQLHTRAWV